MSRREAGGTFRTGGSCIQRGRPAKLQASVLNHCLRQLASLHYVIWRTPSVPGSVRLDYLHD